MIDVSVVIPVYNAEQWIVDTLKSVNAQTYPHERLEIILVDDGSTDNSVEVAHQYLSHQDIEYNLVEVENGGPSRARNIGWRMARGRWIQFLDADDLLAPTKIEKQLLPSVNDSEDIAVIYSEWQRFRDSINGCELQGEIVAPQINHLPVDLLRADSFIATGSQLFSKQWLNKVDGFKEELNLIEDVHLLIRLAIEEGKFHHIHSKEPLFFYRQTSNSLSKREPHEDFIQACLRNTKLIEKFLEQNNMLNFHTNTIICDVYLQAARYHAGKDWERFDNIVKVIESYNPNFIPSNPRQLRLASILFGYRNAEHIAYLYRNVLSKFSINP